MEVKAKSEGVDHKTSQKLQAPVGGNIQAPQISKQNSRGVPQGFKHQLPRSSQQMSNAPGYNGNGPGMFNGKGKVHQMGTEGYNQYGTQKAKGNNQSIMQSGSQFQQRQQPSAIQTGWPTAPSQGAMLSPPLGPPMNGIGHEMKGKAPQRLPDKPQQITKKAEKMSTIQKLAAQLRQVKELQAKLQATLAKKKAATASAAASAAVPKPNTSQSSTAQASAPTQNKAIQRQTQVIENLSKHIHLLQGQKAAAPQRSQGSMRGGMAPAAAAQLFGAPPSKWNVGQVLRWLDSVGFGVHKDAFSRNGVDGRQLTALSFQVLRNVLGIKDEESVKRILAAVDSLRNAESEKKIELGAKRKYSSMSGPMDSMTTNVPIPQPYTQRQPRNATQARAATTRQKRSRKRYAWIATIESWILEHEMHCSNYRPGEKQTQGPQENICCNNLRNGAQYNLRVVPNSNKCCGVTDLIILCNSETKQIVGSLPCSMTQFLAPLIQNELIVLTGATTCVIHPEGGVPPFELAVEADLMRLAGFKRDPQFRMHIRKLTCLLDNWEGDWIDSDYPTNIESIKNLLNID
mmetsp:Transcript_11398/g.17040  ORF Transcript_11398/g.17040 Transcript_11398/m.17040 type:complete len:572 (-) Transcript_11398:174-1889(-)